MERRARTGCSEENIRTEERGASNLYSSPSIIRMIKSRRNRWTGHVARMGRGGMHMGFGGKPDGKRPLRSPRRRWEDNIKMEIRWGGMVLTGLIDSGYGPVEGTCIQLHGVRHIEGEARNPICL
jgi:hypothetical protein